MAFRPRLNLQVPNESQEQRRGWAIFVPVTVSYQNYFSKLGDVGYQS